MFYPILRDLKSMVSFMMNNLKVNLCKQGNYLIVDKISEETVKK